MLLNNKNERGFSLIEVMISIGLLSTVVMFSMSYLEAQRKGSARLNDQAARKSLAIQLSEDITRNSVYTPPIELVNKKGFYVNCYNGQNQQTENKFGKRETTLVFRAQTGGEFEITDICLFEKGSRYQSVYWWDSSSVILRLFEISQTGPRERSVMYRISF